MLDLGHSLSAVLDSCALPTVLTLEISYLQRQCLALLSTPIGELGSIYPSPVYHSNKPLQHTTVLKLRWKLVGLVMYDVY